MKNFFKSILFLFMLLLSFQYYEEKIFKKNNELVYYSYYTIPKDSIDLLFIGSSHSYCSFNPRLFDHYLKCNSLNLGTDAQSLSITYSAILEMLKRQNPKVIVMEIYPITRKPSIVALRPHLDTMSFSINKLILIKNSLPIAEWGNHFMNTIYYHNRWKEFFDLRNLKYKGYGSPGSVEHKGFLGYILDAIRNSLTYNVYENDYSNSFNNSFIIPEKSLKLLESLFKICQKKGIKVILTSPPIIGDYNTLGLFNNSFLKSLMDKYNIDSIDFNNRSKKYEKICFLDNGHLSLAGADEVSFEMAKYLKKNYPILLNTKNYENLDRSPEYYFYSENLENDKNFNLDLKLEKEVFINKLKIYKKSKDTFDLFFVIDEKKTTSKIYEIALNDNEININLDKIQLNFITTQDDEQKFPKYYIRKIRNQMYIFKKDINIPKDSIYYF